MKKLWIALAGLGVLLLLGGMGYVLLFMEEDGSQAVQANGTNQSSGQPRLNTHKKIETQADLLETLDYEITQNRDTVGWLQIPGTSINNSVVQSHDNETYLRRNERREKDVYGCYFADYECSIGSREELSPNTIIYGHSDLKDNPDGPRFSQLFRFTDPKFAKNTPVIQFSTMQDFMNWQVFAVLYADLEFPFFYADPPGGIEKLAAAAMEKSLYDYGVTVGPDDHVLVLSTCTVKYGEKDTNHRFLVMAKLLPEDAPISQQAQWDESES